MIKGEASAHLGEDFKEKHPSVPWARMKAIRNKMIHEYFGVDFEIVWTAIREDLSPLRDEIRRIMGERIEPRK